VDLPALALGLYKVLMDRCGATAYWKDDFVRWFTTAEPSWNREFRFQGDLGFGGKFWRNHGHFYVSCYAEDETQPIRAVMNAVNDELALYPYPKEWA